MTFAAEEPGQILSQDAQGRVLVSRERRESLLEEYDRSGMSGMKFALCLGIKYSLNGTHRVCTEDHEDHKEISLDGSFSDVPPCEATCGGFRRLRCVH